MTVFCSPQCGYTMQPSALTRREIEVLKLVAAGLKAGKIAEKLCLSPGNF